MANAITVPLGLGRVDTAERDWHTAEEIRAMIAGAADHGELSARERSLVLNSLALGRRTAKQIVVPRVKIVSVDLRKPMDENRRVLTEHLHTRVPLCDGGLDNVVGVVATKEFLSAYHAAGDASVLRLIARPAVFAPETIPIDRLLLVFDENKAEMVFLVDEHGGLEGLVTLRDVVDELIGPPLEDATAAPRIVAGDMPLRDLTDALGVPPTEATTVVTVGGLVAERLGRIPVPGDEVQVDGLTMRVLEADARAARRLEVTHRTSA
ncbi:MAG TPA: transporter associated domain-containing protein, partial [Tepidisphaeraceae bacterium]|nr:transporter associated domain-containing protein [Tepidisphaeraceae bacterium]